ncbi:hypothetical protein PIB30_033243 [Stylosanthes scabra]|uniref:Pentatricopeptide repeat-containing protein n=1 Tax=Stylosanthes scabra TaxID=79078 RepID=A0ABU6WAF9_9FABA|nr:hypothetical protein [Stylosanthes scabra]
MPPPALPPLKGNKPYFFYSNRTPSQNCPTGHTPLIVEDLKLQTNLPFLPSSSIGLGKPPNEKQFEILIRMHFDANRGLRVYYVYEKTKKFGVKPRAFFYNRVMDEFVKTDHLDLALSVYDDFREDGLVEEPDVFAYTTLVRMLVPGGNLDGCLRVWAEMKKDKVEPDVMVYATIIIGLSKAGRVEEGYRADLEIYNFLTEGLCNLNTIEKAYKLFQVTIKEGLEPNFSSVKLLLAFTHLKSKGYASVEMYNILMDSLYNIVASPRGFGMMLVRDCLANIHSGPVESKYSLTFIGACRLNDVEKVIEVLNEMMQQGCPLGIVTCSAVISGMSKHKTIEEARKVFSNLRDRRLLTEADTIVYDELLIDDTKKRTSDLLLLGIKFFGLESKLKSKRFKFLPR